TQTSSLPLPPTPLIGRAREVAALQEFLLSGPARDGMAAATEIVRAIPVRLQTLLGPGGVGQNRPALEGAAPVKRPFADGVTFVSLAALRERDLLAASIAQALGIRDTGGQTPEGRLLEYVRQRHMLLVLDNMDYVLGASPLLAELLARCPHLRILVTSRARLHLRAEHCIVIEPLGLPDPADLARAEAVRAAPAVALFVQCVRMLMPDFAVTSENAATIGSICRRLDGLPLAIELAAARLTVLPPHRLLARLDASLRVLVGGARDLPEHQQTLRATLAWSHEMLHAGEKA